MKIATYQRGDAERVGVVIDEQVFDLAQCTSASAQGESANVASVLALLAAGQQGLDDAHEAVSWAQANGDATLVQPFSEVELMAPLPCPGKHRFCLN